MMREGKGLAFVGHRTASLPLAANEEDPARIRLASTLLAEITGRAAQGYYTFYCGAGLGSDILFGQQVLLAKAAYPSIRLVCVIPHEEQAKRWTEPWRDQYYQLLEQADETVLISVRYTRDCYYRRNRFMVDSADALLVLSSDYHTGRTAYTAKYARRQAKEIVWIDPNTLKRRATYPEETKI